MEMNVDQEKNLVWKFLMGKKPGDELFDLSTAVFKIIRYAEFWRREVRKRQDTIYKLRAENKKLRKQLFRYEA